ncbi:MAG: histidine--tRNA ligase family protein, partial [Thermoplasmata archaeon]|nr:histidine--tRNA ligase family protein [Thermoplasmata archaeon]
GVGLKNFKVRIGFIGIYRDLLRKLGFKDDEITDALHMLDKKDIDGFKRLAAKKKASDRAGEAIISIRDRQGGIEVLDGIEGPAKDYLKEMMGYLLALGISGCEIDLGIIRGLDYYSGMVFEIDAPNLGAEKQICGGGSYDLVPLFGGEQAFTTGFAIGFDRVLLALELEGFRQTTAPLDAFVIPVGDDARKVALEIVSSLRREEMSADFDIMRRSLSKSLKYASLVKAKKAIIIGDKELAKGAAIVRDMGTGEQSEVKIDQIAGSLKK